ncbi:hypothetical protein AGMMS49940_08860 [Spirochaetia bacterium]|nr:hypothetical protein AGMMS49940_08860 [Spirochaetia bacterium]
MGTGPSTKETTLHHYRDPLCKLLAGDSEVDFLGLILAGTSDEDEQKAFIARRIGAQLESMRLDGVLVSIDSWGNCHIDFASVIEAIGERGIPLVGLSFVGTQAAFVVVNSYMNSIIDLNKTTDGVESLVIGENTAVELDAIKAVAILKNKIRNKESGKSWRVGETKKLRRLIVRTFAVTAVDSGAGAGNANFSKGRLSLNLEELQKAGRSVCKDMESFVKDFSLRIINCNERSQLDLPVNSILDFSPVAAKVNGRMGEGISHDFSGMCVMLTAVEENGFQPANIGASDGVLGKKVCFGRPGTPAAGDYILNIDVILKEGHARTREGIMAAHELCDAVIRPVRDLLRALPSSDAANKAEYWDTVRSGGYKIALVKLVPGLGCLYDTLLFPEDPAGYAAGKSIMDRSNNVQIPISPNEYRDGAVHSLT